jgi:uroporphyrinogen decarboxylase
MNGLEIFRCLASGHVPDRVPFVPTIYEHAASLLHLTPSVLARNPDRLVDGQLAAWELYRHDLVSVGVDIYNVEAEALGMSVAFHDGPMLPSLTGTLIDDPSDLANLRVPNPDRDGRMPMFTEAVRRLKDRLGHEVPVNGTIVGPFTLAAILRGYENFLMDMMFEEAFALRQLQFARDVGLAYAEAYAAIGIGVAVNESWIAPPLLSPVLFERHVFPFEADLIRSLKKMGMHSVSLICGGDTMPIAHLLVKTGTSMLMADANTDQKAYKRLCEMNGINLRASIESKMVETGSDEELETAVSRVIGNCAENGRFIFGCGIVSYNTPPGQVLKLKEMVTRNNPYGVCPCNLGNQSFS